MHKKINYIILNNRIMHRGLPLVESIKLVGFSSSEMKFGTSVNSVMLVGLHVVHFWIPGSRSDLCYLP
jgi:hypothetical protein